MEAGIYDSSLYREYRMSPILRTLCLLLLSFTAISCAPITETRVHIGAKVALPRTIGVLSFQNETGEESLKGIVLRSFQENLVKKLQSSGHFEKVMGVTSVESVDVDGVVACKITQYDPFVRRIVVQTEVLDLRTQSVLRRMVTRSDLASIVWPLDYLVSTEALSSSVVTDIASEMSK